MRNAGYLFNRYNDKVVMRPVSNWLETIYAKRLGSTRAGNLFYQTAIGAGHPQVTLDYGARCAASRAAISTSAATIRPE